MLDLEKMPPLLANADREKPRRIRGDAQIDVLPIHPATSLGVGVGRQRLDRWYVGHFIHPVWFAVEPADAADGGAAADPACSVSAHPLQQAAKYGIYVTRPAGADVVFHRKTLLDRQRGIHRNDHHALAHRQGGVLVCECGDCSP